MLRKTLTSNGVRFYSTLAESATWIERIIEKQEPGERSNSSDSEGVSQNNSVLELPQLTTESTTPGSSTETKIEFPDITPKRNMMIELLSKTREKVEGREPQDVAEITKRRIEARLYRDKTVSKELPKLQDTYIHHKPQDIFQKKEVPNIYQWNEATSLFKKEAHLPKEKEGGTVNKTNRSVHDDVSNAASPPDLSAAPWRHQLHPPQYPSNKPLSSSNRPFLSSNRPPLSSYNPPPKQLRGTPSVAGAKNSQFSSHRKLAPLDLKIPLDRFCIHYDIPKSNQVKLATLEYSPGNDDVMELEESDWKEAGFSKLGWKAFIRAHQQFMKDAEAGIWVV